jgi:hypothetical protein
MDSCIILISSDSSAPSSPVHEFNSKDTPDYCGEEHPDSDAIGDTTVDYYMPINERNPAESDHDSCETSLSKVNTNAMDCTEVQLSDTDPQSDTTVDNYPPFHFLNQLVSKTEHQECGISGSCAAGVSDREMQLVDHESSNDR